MAAPSITAINPATGSGDGGVAVLITGTGFSTATAVAFGDTAAAFTVQSATTITATAPVHAAGAVRVKVTNPDGDSPDTAADDFTYTDPTAALCTLAQIKTRSGISGTDRDAQIADLITMVLRRLNLATGREFMPYVTEARTFPVFGTKVVLEHSDLRSATGVVLHPENADELTTLTDGTDYTLRLERLTTTTGILRLSEALALTSTHSSYFGYAKVEITGSWGIWNSVSSVPDDLNAAAIECILSWLDKPVQTVTSYDLSGVREALPPNPGSWDIPRSAWLKIQPYVRHWGVY